MRVVFTLLVLFILAWTAVAQQMTGSASRPAFQPEGMWIWDNWFVHDGQRWHAFYLELSKAVGAERRWKNNDPLKHVGHAVSDDLKTWKDLGTALTALPDTWNDRHIATGSVIHHENRWWMFFTGRGRHGDGVGLALSDDLMTWKTEPQPLFPLGDTFASTSKTAFESPWEGKPQRWVGISDPYVYPEAIEGWFYLVICARVLDVPLEESGCLSLLRSRDLRAWEPAGIIAWPHCFERMETPQLWSREGRWYLSFGGVLNAAWAVQHPAQFPEVVRGRRSHLNYCYTWADFRQPARSEDLHFVDAPAGGYIMKVEPASPGRDVALFTVTETVRGTCLSAPFAVIYPPGGGVQLATSHPSDSAK
jgi:beta-fructofuranosidase